MAGLFVIQFDILESKDLVEKVYLIVSEHCLN